VRPYLGAFGLTAAFAFWPLPGGLLLVSCGAGAFTIGASQQQARRGHRCRPLPPETTIRTHHRRTGLLFSLLPVVNLLACWPCSPDRNGRFTASGRAPEPPLRSLAFLQPLPPDPEPHQQFVIGDLALSMAPSYSPWQLQAASFAFPESCSRSPCRSWGHRTALDHTTSPR